MVYAGVGGLTQIFATLCVLSMFKYRNFAVGITFKKTEVILVALVGFVLLGEGISSLGFGAILLGLIGLLLLSKQPLSGQGLWNVMCLQFMFLVLGLEWQESLVR